ncbi:hypothetical protein H9Y04_43350 [Streptomyces sp. TRM66268-LWL]|uniref:Uncharacterized protein n=1 Tax=Streptomyces polyasparticus TaxID=2767826 RepID=A0ABR7SYC1_9ACTN|nr:hypothetical protein [Streptomyces polyasparticus]MBC9719368.1 hypothetical protein [Streptomyces polyasparticus]
MSPAPVWAGNAVVYRWTSCTPNPAAAARAVLRRSLTRLRLPADAVSDAVLVVSEQPPMS